MRSEIRDGLAYVLGHRYLRSIAASTGSSNLFSNIAFTVYLLYVVRVLGLQPAEIGLVFGLGNIGALVGAVAARPIANVLGVGRTIILSMLLDGPGIVLVAVAPRELAIPFLIAAGFTLGVANMVYNINQVSLRQAITPTTMQGRMNATMRFIVWGTIPVGTILGGLLGNTVGLHETIWIGAIGNCFTFLPLLVGPLRHLREMPEPLAEGEPATQGPAEGGIGGRDRDESGLDHRERRPATLELRPEPLVVGQALDETPSPVVRPPLSRDEG